MQNKKQFKRYTVTSALPYANGPLHIGHLAGVYVPADLYVRYLRSNEKDVVFIGGSDEHGVPITIKAWQQGVTPQDIVDKYHELIKKSFAEFGISFDIYSRTSNKIHHETSSEMFKKMYDEGKFVEKYTEQYYDESHQTFLSDRYIIGTCPICSYEKAYGDQCENCGTSLNATDLINPRSVLSGKEPVLRKTKHWYLPLDQYTDWLKEWILEGHKVDWKTNVYGQVKSWIDQGLQPRAVTRDLNWGVKVPLSEAEGKVLYVWFDAPIGYISATREWAEQKGVEWEKWWKDPETRLIHFIGKDNIVFHCIIFPIMLKAEGSYIVPDNVPAFEFLNLEGQKISTSNNWAVWLHEYLVEFKGKQDVLRYVLLANAPETKDNDFTWKDFQTRNNSELVAILGNFVNRTLVLTHKYFDALVPQASQFNEDDLKAIAEIEAIPERISMSLENFRFREALAEMMNLARLGNKYLTDNEPWKIFKSDPDRVKSVLNISLQICANLTIVAAPFLPFTAKKLSDMLNIGQMKWKEAGNIHLLKPGHRINNPELLFEKIEDETINAQIEKLNATSRANQNDKFVPNPLKEPVQYDEFAKMDIRTGTILEAEKVAKTKKLMKLTIDTGIDKRTVVSGIAEHYDAKDLIGRKVCILVNLAPKELRGITSHGMILMAENPDGSLGFVAPPDNYVDGTEIK